MMQLKTGSRGRSLVEICHQVPGRTRVRVPILAKVTDLEKRIAAALAALDGVGQVRLNSACGSLVLHHRPDVTPTRDDLLRALKPVLVPPTLPVPATRTAPRRSHESKVGAAARTKRGVVPLTASCPVCQLKLRAARWLLNDVWHCWWDDWRQRLHGRLVASLALLRA